MLKTSLFQTSKHYYYGLRATAKKKVISRWKSKLGKIPEEEQEEEEEEEEEEQDRSLNVEHEEFCKRHSAMEPKRRQSSR